MAAQPQQDSSFDIGKMLAMMQALYGMQQEQQLGPARIASAEADAESKRVASSHAQDIYDMEAKRSDLQQQLLDAQIGRQQAETGYLDRGRDQDPDEAAFYRHLAMGGDPKTFTTHKGFQGQQADEAAKKHQAQVDEEARLHEPPPPLEVTAFGGREGGWVPKAYDFYNMTGFNPLYNVQELRKPEFLNPIWNTLFGQPKQQPTR